jgi:hypothetical protein
LSASSSVAALCTDRFLKWMFCSSSSMMVTCSTHSSMQVAIAVAAAVPCV